MQATVDTGRRWPHSPRVAVPRCPEPRSRRARVPSGTLPLQRRSLRARLSQGRLPGTAGPWRVRCFTWISSERIRATLAPESSTTHVSQGAADQATPTALDSGRRSPRRCDLKKSVTTLGSVWRCRKLARGLSSRSMEIRSSNASSTKRDEGLPPSRSYRWTA